MPSLIIPVPDFRTLMLLAASSEGTKNGAAGTWLIDELERATVVTPEVVPTDVVTMHTRLEYRDDVTDQVERMTLVYPGEEHWDQQSVSVLSPLGTAVLGLSEKQSIRWRTPSSGLRGVTVLRVMFQPYRCVDDILRRYS